MSGQGTGTSPRPITARARSSTIVGTGYLPNGSGGSGGNLGPPSIDVSASSFRITTNPSPGPSTGAGATSTASAAAESLSSQLSIHGTVRRPRLQTAQTGHNRITSWPSPPQPVIMAAPSAPAVPTRASIDNANMLDLSALNIDKCSLLLYTYKPSTTTGPAKDKDIPSQPSPLPSSSTPISTPSSQVLINYAALPWHSKPGDYLEIRRINRKDDARSNRVPDSESDERNKIAKSSATRGVKMHKGRDGYVFRLGEDMPNVTPHQIQVPDSVAAAFGFQHRLEVQIRRIHDKESAHTDYVEFYFSQYLGRADMWRLGMSLEGTTLHVGEKVSLAGGAVRAEVNFVIRTKRELDKVKNKQYSSGIVTAKTKTIFRSKSAQVYLFIQLCHEMWEFDEDGEQYVEKIVHGYLPDLFAKWAEEGTSHVVTIIFFARIYYDADEVAYMTRHDMTTSLFQDYSGRWCKDFFKVAIDLERRNDWTQALPEIKKQLESCEKEILLNYHLDRLNAQHDEHEQRRIIGKWSFAYEGNVLEAINLALNPFDEHYVDRDLSRTGLQITIVTPGTGHFSVDKNLLRLTTERTVDHGLSVDFLCLTKMPLHSVPLYSYVSHKPKPASDESQPSKLNPVTPDLLYFDAHMSNAKETELADCYSLPSWVSCSFYSVTHDKPFRKDRFVPRCKMYDIQMLGILDHNMTTVIVPLLDVEDTPMPRRPLSLEDRKAIRDKFDANIFGGKTDQADKHGSPQPDSFSASASIPASYQSARLLAEKVKQDKAESHSQPRHSFVRPGTKLSPIKAKIEHDEAETLGTKRISYRSASPAPSSLSLKRARDVSPYRSPHAPTPMPIMGSDPKPTIATNGQYDTPVLITRSASPLPPQGDLSPTQATRSGSPLTISRARSPSRASVLSFDPGSGASTPKTTPGKKLQNKSSKSSFASRFGANWLFGSLTRAQPSFATPAMETAARTDVSGVTGNKPGSPKKPGKAKAAPPHVARAMNMPNFDTIITPSTPSPSKEKTQAQATQPLPIATASTSRFKYAPATEEDAISRSLRAKSHDDSSWRQKNTQLVQSTKHFTVNPCKPSAETIARVRDSGGRRWQFVLPFRTEHHIVKWPSLVAPACLPLTTDFLPTQRQTDELYTTGNYTVQCYLEDGAFFIRNDAAESNLPLAMMREMVSQRLSQNFQVIVLPHELSDPGTSHPMPIHLEKDADIGVELVSGGASEVLKNGQGAIWLSWAHHIHRLLFHPTKQEIIVHWMTRKVSHSTEPVKYKCLVWPSGMKGYQRAAATFNYPDVNTKINYNHLDHLINGERQTLEPLRYWRTRYILIPSGKEPASMTGLVPKGEEFDQVDLQWLGAQKVIETLNRYLQKKGDTQTQNALRIVPTTFDPSTCVLDEELMMDLERQISGKEEVSKERGRTLEGMTLAQVAELMSQPGNGLVIRTRWWEARQHVQSFTGAQFAEWLQSTFEDISSREKAAEWAKSLLEKGLIEHVTNSHGFLDYWHLYYRLREPYDVSKKESKNKGWFGGKAANGSGSGDTTGENAMTASTSTGTTGTNSLSASVSGQIPNSPSQVIATPPNARSLLAKIYEGPDHEHDEGNNGNGNGDRKKKRKIKMSQTRVLDLDTTKKSDRAEVAILHADIVHNARNAFHFELNWLGVTAALLEELRQKLAAQAERYGLRFVETPVEQLLDIPLKCAYRTAIPIPLALAPPIIPDLHKRLVAVAHGTGQASHYFEYSILTRKFGFVLDVEGGDRYPDNIEVVYSYRKGKQNFDYSQFCHRSGLVLVQCLGGERGFLFSENRLVTTAPVRRAGAGKSKDGRIEETRNIKEELIKFCSDPKALKEFYDEVTPPLPKDDLELDLLLESGLELGSKEEGEVIGNDNGNEIVDLDGGDYDLGAEINDNGNSNGNGEKND